MMKPSQNTPERRVIHLRIDMDIKFFYKQRSEFILYFYTNASEPFIDIKRKIESEEEPYIPQNLCQEEPEYLTEWIEAEEAFHTVGYTCLSMLSSALHSYLKSWLKNIKNTQVNEDRFKKGWFNGYKKILNDDLGININESNADLELIESISLARNRIQHPESITTNYVDYSKKDVRKIRNLPFVSKNDPIEEVLKEKGLNTFFTPSIRPDSEDINKAFSDSEKLVCFLEGKFLKLQNV